MSTVVVGLGNAYRHDDAVGPLVAERLCGRLPPAVRVVGCDGDVGRLLEAWDGVELAVVVDAARVDPPTPGRVHRFDGSSGAAPAGAGTHSLSLADAVALGTVLGRLPGRLVVYAVEGGDFSAGVGVTPAVLAAVEAVTERVVAEVSTG